MRTTIKKITLATLLFTGVFGNAFVVSQDRIERIIESPERPIDYIAGRKIWHHMFKGTKMVTWNMANMLVNMSESKLDKIRPGNKEIFRNNLKLMLSDWMYNPSHMMTFATMEHTDQNALIYASHLLDNHEIPAKIENLSDKQLTLRMELMHYEFVAAMKQMRQNMIEYNQSMGN